MNIIDENSTNNIVAKQDVVKKEEIQTEKAPSLGGDNNGNINPCLHLDNDNANSEDISNHLGVEDHPRVQLLSMAFNVVENLDFLWENRFSNLNILNLSFNKLVNIDAIECIPSLKVLRCTSNKIEKLPSVAVFSRLTNLEEFWINRNKLINLEDTILALTGAPSLKKLVLCKNPCCKTSIDALYFHYVTATLEFLDILDGKRITPAMKVKGIDYISSPLGQNLVLQMSQRGRNINEPGPYARRPRSQPKSARAKLVTAPARSKSQQVLRVKRKVRTNNTDTSELNNTAINTVRTRTSQNDNDDNERDIDFDNADTTFCHADDHNDVEKYVEEQSKDGEQSGASDGENNVGNNEDNDELSTLGFDSISAMLPSFSSSKLGGRSGKKIYRISRSSKNSNNNHRPPRPSKYRNNISSNSEMKFVTKNVRRKKTKRSDAISEESRYKSLGLSSASTQILRENRLATKVDKIPSTGTKSSANISTQSLTPPITKDVSTRNKPSTNNGRRPSKNKVSIANAVKEPTPLPKSLASWEDGKAEKVVDFSTISSLLPDFSSKLSLQIEKTRRDRSKHLPRGRRKNKDVNDDTSVFHSEYMRNKGKRKTKAKW
eukprot:g218.t1